MLLGDEEEEENGNLLPNVTEDVDPSTQDFPDSSQGSQFWLVSLISMNFGVGRGDVGGGGCDKVNVKKSIYPDSVKINLIWNVTLKIWYNYYNIITLDVR